MLKTDERSKDSGSCRTSLEAIVIIQPYENSDLQQTGAVEVVPNSRITDSPGSGTAAIRSLQFPNLCAPIWLPIEERSNFASYEITTQKHVIYTCLSSTLNDVATQLLSFRHWLPKMLTKATGRWRCHIQTQSQQTENSEMIVLEWDSQDSKSSVLIQAWKGQSHAYVKDRYACVDQRDIPQGSYMTLLHF